MDISKLRNGFQVWVEGFAGDSATRILVRHINQDEFEIIVKGATEHTIDLKNHQRVGRLNEDKYHELLVDAAVVDWEGFSDSGAPFPCTPENRRWLMKVSTDFRSMVKDVPLTLEKALALEKDDQIKN